ncbi:LON peptidase substrate-binding domain-containing protein [Paracoccaceae bacterium GXU_MW_L88]
MVRAHSIADLPREIPLFPLDGALLLPRARLPLNIFEPRYLQMIENVLKTPDRLIGMIQKDGRGNLQKIGCAGRLTSFTETDDGRYLISLGGISRFRLSDVNEGFMPYRVATVRWDGFERDIGGTERDPGFDRARFLKLLADYFEQNELSTDWDALEEADTEMLINSLSMLLPFTSEDKQALLEAPSLTTRRETMVTLIEFSLCGGEGPVQ